MLLQKIEKHWHYYLTIGILGYLWEKKKVNGWLIKKGASGSDCPIICSSPSYPLMWMSKFVVSQLPWSFVLWFSSKYRLNVSSRNMEKSCERAAVNVWFSALLWILWCLFMLIQNLRAIWEPSVQVQCVLQNLPLRNSLIRFSIHNSCWVSTLFLTI